MGYAPAVLRHPRGHRRTPHQIESRQPRANPPSTRTCLCRRTLGATRCREMGSTMTRGDGHSGGGKSLTRRSFLLAGLMGAAGLAGCSSVPTLPIAGGSDGSASPTGGSASGDRASVTIDDAAWHYDWDNDVYYQIGIRYCANPAASEYESMAIYVPGAYFVGTSNGDDDLHLPRGRVRDGGAYAASAAPVVIPVNTAGYSAQRAPSPTSPTVSPSTLRRGWSTSTPAVAVATTGRTRTGPRSRAAHHGASPTSKAAVRCLRYNARSIPGEPSASSPLGTRAAGRRARSWGYGRLRALHPLPAGDRRRAHRRLRG